MHEIVVLAQQAWPVFVSALWFAANLVFWMNRDCTAANVGGLVVTGVLFPLLLVFALMGHV